MSPRKRPVACAPMVGVVVASLTALLAGCRQPGPQASPAPAEGSCVADSVGTLRLLGTVPRCAAEDPACRGRCTQGDAGSCLAMAYASEKESKTAGQAAGFYRRACLLGAANGCTNEAAGLWAREDSEERLACARRTFEKACAAKEPYACGMVGRILLESTTPPAYAEGRRHLEAACTEVGGFSCRVLAKHLESGKLGEYPPERIRTLLARACAMGDPSACGEHRTAAETFH